MSSHDSLTPIDVTASTLEQAIHDGLDRLGLSRNDVIIEIIEEGSRGVLGMGARNAVVRLTPLRPPAHPVEPAAPPVEPVPPAEEEEEEPELEAAEPEVIVEEPEEEEEPAEESHPGTQRELPPWAVPSDERREPEYRTVEDAEAEAFVEEEAEDEDEYEAEEEYEVEEEEDEEEEEYVPSRTEALSGEDIEYEAKIARAALVELLEHMEVDADVDVYHAKPAPHEDDAPWILDVRGNDLGILIGRHGETLNALQYITRLIVSRELQRRANIVVDVEGYKARREDSLRKLAGRMADKAVQSGRTVTLDPMPPNERRVIHVVLRGDSRVETESIGSGDSRRVTIIPSGGSSSNH